MPKKDLGQWYTILKIGNNGLSHLSSYIREDTMNSGKMFLRKDGSFGDSMLKVIEGSFFLTKNTK